MTRPRIISVIDVGSSKVCTLIGQVTEGEGAINIVGASSVPSSGVRKGQIVNIDEATETVVKSVECAERMAGFSLNRILVTVGGSHISSQNSHGVVAVAEPEKEITDGDVRRVIEAARAISLPSSREILHVIPRTYTVDSQEGVADPEGMSGVRLEVETHIITGSSTALKNLKKCVSEVGAEISDLVFSGISSAEAVLTETERELGVILIDVGGGTTNIVVYIEGSPCYATVLPVGAKNVTNDLAIGLRLSLDGAEKLKINLSKVSAEEDKQDDIDLNKLGIYEETKTVSKKTIVEGIIKPRLNEIFGMAADDVSKNGFAGLTPSGVVITGGGALTVGAVEVCRRAFSLPARIGIPDGVKGLVEEILNPSFASPIGSLLRSCREKKFSEARIFPMLGGVAEKIPIKGTVGKICSFLKSFLP